MTINQLPFKIGIYLISLITSFQALGQFGDQVEITRSTSAPSSIGCFDLDNDGDLDILCSSKNDGKISWYPNLGNGQFGIQQVVSVKINGCLNATAFDIDQDGDLEIITTSPDNNKVLYFTNFGNGLFGPGTYITHSLDGASGAVAADFNGDGLIDVAACSANDHKLVWYQNNGNGSFSAPKSIHNFNVASFGPIIYHKIGAGDIDNDGDIDVFASGLNMGTIIKNDGLGNFSNPNTINAYSMDMNLKDVDQDGDLDMLYASFKKATIRLNNGSSSPTEHTIYTIPNVGPCNTCIIHEVAFGDVDGDGKEDAVIYQTDSLKWYRNLGGGQFGPKQDIYYSPSSYPTGLFCEDVNNDGNVDITATTENDDVISWFENQGGQFASQQIVNQHTNMPYRIFCGDLDGDNDNDVLFAAQHGEYIGWYENLGWGVFDDEQKLINNITSYLVHVADLDNDGKLDIITPNGYNLVWCKNLGSGNFGNPNNIFISSAPFTYNDIKTADYDNDGDLDVVMAAYNNIQWFDNTGTGTFQIGSNMPGPNIWSVKSIALGDFNNDTLTDLFYAQGSSNIGYFKGTGPGQFATKKVINTNASGPNHVYLADLNEDGLIDLLSSSSGDNKVAWYKNLIGGFSSINGEKIISQNIQNANSVIAKDINGDGRADVVYGGSENGPDKIAWRENLIGNFFGSEQIISSRVKTPRDIALEDLDADGDFDVISASQGDDKVAWYQNLYQSPFRIGGTTFYDANQNGLRDGNDFGLKDITVLISPHSKFNFSDSIGYYSHAVDTGIKFQINPAPSNLWRITTSNTNYTASVSKNLSVIDTLDFGFYPDTIAGDLNLGLDAEFPRCGSGINFWPSVKNTGTIMSKGIVHLQLDDLITYVGAIIQPDSVVGQNIYWHYDSLLPTHSKHFFFNVANPSFAFVGDTMISIMKIIETSSANPTTYIDTLSQVLSCAYDPNDKSVDPKGVGPAGLIEKDQTLEFLIRFQNIGTASARDVIIIDQLDNNLNWSSVKPISSSHKYKIWISDNGQLTFSFKGIMLPSRNGDEPNSHGYVKFEVDMKKNLRAFTPIFNSAKIYFDNNPAITTNITINTIDSISNISIPEPILLNEPYLFAYPNPTSGLLTLYLKSEIEDSYEIRIYSLAGELVFEKSSIKGQKLELNLNSLKRGVYILQGFNHEILFNTKFVRQ